jgi:hypothetical protein
MDNFITGFFTLLAALDGIWRETALIEKKYSNKQKNKKLLKHTH